MSKNPQQMDCWWLLRRAIPLRRRKLARFRGTNIARGLQFVIPDSTCEENLAQRPTMTDGSRQKLVYWKGNGVWLDTWAKSGKMSDVRPTILLIALYVGEDSVSPSIFRRGVGALRQAPIPNYRDGCGDVRPAGTITAGVGMSKNDRPVRSQRSSCHCGNQESRTRRSAHEPRSIS